MGILAFPASTVCTRWASRAVLRAAGPRTGPRGQPLGIEGSCATRAFTAPIFRFSPRGAPRGYEPWPLEPMAAAATSRTSKPQNDGISIIRAGRGSLHQCVFAFAPRHRNHYPPLGCPRGTARTPRPLAEVRSAAGRRNRRTGCSPGCHRSHCRERTPGTVDPSPGCHRGHPDGHPAGRRAASGTVDPLVADARRAARPRTA